MKIVFLIDYFQPKLGYQEFFLAREMQKLGHQIFVVTSNYYFPFPDYQNTVFKVLGEREKGTGVFIEEGLTVHRLPLLFETKNGAVTLLRNFKKTLFKIKPEIIFSDGVFTPLAFQAASCKKRIGYKLFYDSHTSNFNSKLDNTIPKKLYMFFLKTFLIPYIKKSADGFTAVGESERALLCKEYNLKPDRVKLIPLGADTEIFYPDLKKRKEMRQKLGVHANEVLIVHAGKIAKNKDIDILFKALSSIFKKLKKTKLLIISGGEEDLINNLKLYAQTNGFNHQIIWQQPVENKLLANFYNAGDIGIWPGNLSNTIIEAMACGLPVILPKVICQGQTSSHLLENGNGLSFKRGDFDELAEKIKLLVNNKRKIERMALNSRKLVKDNLSWQIIAKKYLDLYEKREK